MSDEKKDEKKVLHKTKWFDVIQKGSMIGTEVNSINVVVMPFERDLRGLPRTIGVLKEYNPMRENNYSITLVTGTSEEEDPDILTTAKRELKEESGYDVEDIDRWYFLGFLTATKFVKQEHPCFAVDITGIKPEEKTTDGSKSEQLSEFMVLPVKQALKTDDCYVPALFMKMFRFIFGFEAEEKDIDDDTKLQRLKSRLDMKYLNITGVIQSDIQKNEAGEPYIVYQVQEITPDIEQMIPKEVDGVHIMVVKVQDTQAAPIEPAKEPETPKA
jgi:8-oxo-dGTP pyrophosphatase MutT (NUDIX family)